MLVFTATAEAVPAPLAPSAALSERATDAADAGFARKRRGRAPVGSQLASKTTNRTGSPPLAHAAALPSVRLEMVMSF